MTHQPYVRTNKALQQITEIAPPVLRKMAEDVLRIINPDVPGIDLATDQLRLRILLHDLLMSAAADSERRIDEHLSGLQLIPEAWRDHMLGARSIPGRGLCCVQRFLVTSGLLADVTFESEASYRYAARYCYESKRDALAALAAWDGTGDPPGDWVKEKISERLGPGADR